MRSVARRGASRTAPSKHREAVNRAVRGLNAANARAKAKAESPTADELRDRMAAVIAERVGEAGTVSREDFRRAGIPLSAINLHYNAALARAREADPSLGKLVALA